MEPVEGIYSLRGVKVPSYGSTGFYGAIRGVLAWCESAKLFLFEHSVYFWYKFPIAERIGGSGGVCS